MEIKVKYIKTPIEKIRIKQSAGGKKGGSANVAKGFAANKELASEAGRKGGSKKGRKGIACLSTEQRKELAKKALAARWGKK